MQTVEYKGRLVVVVDEWYDESCEGCVADDTGESCKDLAEAIKCKRTQTIARELTIEDVPHLDINKGEVNG